MILPLRQRHRVMVCTLAALLPVAFTAGLVARKPVPVAMTVSLGSGGQVNDSGGVVWTKTDLWPGQRIITSLRRDSAGFVAVELKTHNLAKPDVLVYWVPGKEPAVEGLPVDARLLGALSSHTRLPLHPDARGETGRFLLYSLGDHEVLAASNFLVMEKD